MAAVAIQTRRMANGWNNDATTLMLLRQGIFGISWFGSVVVVCFAFAALVHLPLMPLFIKDQDDDKDSCCYPNGIWPVLIAQCLIVAAFFLNAGAFMGCQYVTVPAEKVDSILERLYPDYYGKEGTIHYNNTGIRDRRGLGFLVFEDAYGECAYEYLAYEANETDVEQVLEKDAYRDDDSYAIGYYVEDFLDSWNPGRVPCFLGGVVGLVAAVWMTCFACVRHHRVLRWFLGIGIIVSGTICMGTTFSVLSTEFCHENDCQPGREFGLALAAFFAYFFGGVALLLARDSQQEPKSPQAGTRSPDPALPMPQVLDGIGNATEVPVSAHMMNPSLVGNNNAVVQDGIGAANEVAVNSEHLMHHVGGQGDVNCSSNNNTLSCTPTEDDDENPPPFAPTSAAHSLGSTEAIDDAPVAEAVPLNES